MIETLDKLCLAHPEVFSARAHADVRRRLAARKQAMIRAAARAGGLRDAAVELRTLAKRATHWQSAHSGFAALAPGIDKSHRRARKALARARETQAAPEFHEWRKAVKSLWYTVRLVGGGSAAITRDIRRALDSAERWLGDDHNLFVLCAELSSDAWLRAGTFDFERLRRVWTGCSARSDERRSRESGRFSPSSRAPTSAAPNRPGRRAVAPPDSAILLSLAALVRWRKCVLPEGRRSRRHRVHAAPRHDVFEQASLKAPGRPRAVRARRRLSMIRVSLRWL